MNMEFNDDGSLKTEVPVKEYVDSEKVFENEKAILIHKNQISVSNPCECELTLNFSKHVEDCNRVSEIFRKATGKFKHMSMLNLCKISPDKFTVSIISGQFRCSWCENFIDFLEKESKCKIINETSCMSFYK